MSRQTFARMSMGLLCSVLSWGCMPKKNQPREVAQGAATEVQGADAKGDTSTESDTILFRLTGTDDTVSQSAKASYTCEDGFNEEVTLLLNSDGETEIQIYKDSDKCTIGLVSYTADSLAYLPTEEEAFVNYDVGESAVFATSSGKSHHVLVISQWPSLEVHYQYSQNNIDDDYEPIEDDDNSDNPNQSPTQSPAQSPTQNPKG